MFRFGEVEDGEVAVVVEFEEVCYCAEEVEEVYLEEVGVAGERGAFEALGRGFGFQEVVEDLDGGDGDLDAAGAREANEVGKELFYGHFYTNMNLHLFRG